LYDIQLLDEPRDEYLKKHCIGEAPNHSQSTISSMKMWPLSLLYSRSFKDSPCPLLPSLLGFSYMRQLDLSFFAKIKQNTSKLFFIFSSLYYFFLLFRKRNLENWCHAMKKTIFYNF